jgi:Single-stranded DNA-specific exonuclease
LPELQQRINAYARQVLPPDALTRVYVADGELPLGELTLPLVESLAKLEPHGIGNPHPRFILRGHILEQRILKDQHLKLILGDGPHRAEVLWWQRREYAEQLPRQAKVEVLGRPDINVWQGRTSLQFIATDIRLAT